ncbi:MAG: DUF368 domain-containing protein [Clostridia bacterium]|nr:DUF368 domain-containing protein [Clostridia bacterium]
MNFISNIFKGIAIGAGAILPGISSGVLCVILGIYEKLLDSVLGFFKNIKENLKFLLPIALGTIVGVLIFSKVLNYLLYAYPTQTKSTFVGLILTTIPSLIKDVNKKHKFKLRYIGYLLIALFLGISTVFLEKNMIVTSQAEFNYFYLILCGFFMSIGVIVPGVSSTIILMLLGVYSTYLTSVSEIYLPVLMPMGIGLVLGSFFFMKVTKVCLSRFYAQTFYTIIGFTLGSVLVIWPEFTFDLSGAFSFLCMMIGPMLATVNNK